MATRSADRLQTGNPHPIVIHISVDLRTVHRTHLRALSTTSPKIRRFAESQEIATELQRIGVVNDWRCETSNNGILDSVWTYDGCGAGTFAQDGAAAGQAHPRIQGVAQINGETV